MSIERNREERRDRRRLRRRDAMLTAVLIAVLFFQFFDLRETGAIARLLAQSRRADGCVVLPLPFPGPPTEGAVDGWTIEQRCFRGTNAFATGSPTQCEAGPRTPRVKDGAESACAWEFLDAAHHEQSFDDFLNDAHDGTFGVLAIFGGHDLRHVSSRNTLIESNADLAHRRAKTIEIVLKPMLRGRQWALLPMTGSYPNGCADDTSEPPPFDSARRRPVLLVTLWKAPQ